MQAYSRQLAEAIRSIVDVKEEKDLDSLFTGPTTTAFVNTIKGLDDFELIAFLVVTAGDGPRVLRERRELIMGRVFSNGPLKDFVINPFRSMAAESTQLCIAAPS